MCTRVGGGYFSLFSSLSPGQERKKDVNTLQTDMEKLETVPSDFRHPNEHVFVPRKIDAASTEEKNRCPKIGTVGETQNAVGNRVGEMEWGTAPIIKGREVVLERLTS